MNLKKCFLIASVGIFSTFSQFSRGDTTPIIKLSTKGDDVAFDQVDLNINFAETITIKFSNEATKASQILHNIAVLKPGSTDEVIQDLQKAGYDLGKMKGNKNILAMTKPLEPGASDTITFKPSGPGTYPFICLMAGHGDMLGMKGNIKLQKKL